MPAELTIERRFRGPSESGNGGYACGLLAAHLGDGPVEVTLRLPPPLDRPLAIVRDGDRAEMRDGDALVGEASRSDAFQLRLPEPVSPALAAEVRRRSPLHEHHPYPECFVCGPRRAAGDGLGIVAGPVPGRDGELVASPWETGPELAGADGSIRPELIWAALDCPGGLGGMLLPEVGVTLLGRMAALLLRPLPAGGSCVAMGWPIEHEGRKVLCGSALVDADGEPYAIARATWIEVAGG